MRECSPPTMFYLIITIVLYRSLCYKVRSQVLLIGLPTRQQPLPLPPETGQLLCGPLSIPGKKRVWIWSCFCPDKLIFTIDYVSRMFWILKQICDILVSSTRRQNQKKMLCFLIYHFIVKFGSQMRQN